MGDHVKVIAGRYEGDTGLIVRVEENFVILFSDLTMHEVPALSVRLKTLTSTVTKPLRLSHCHLFNDALVRQNLTPKLYVL